MKGLQVLLNDICDKLKLSFGKMTELYSYVEFVEANGTRVTIGFEDFKKTTDTTAEKLVAELKERVLPKFENRNGLIIFHFVFYGECSSEKSVREKDAIHVGCAIDNNSIGKIWTVISD